MEPIDRRNWIKTIGLGSSLALLGGFKSLAFEAPKRSAPEGLPIRLNANENPYGPSARVLETIRASFNEVCRYPFGKIQSLVRLIAEKEGVSEGHVVVTGGSTEGLKAAGLVYGLSGGEIIAADPTFQALLTYAETFGAYVHRVPLNDRLEHDLPAMGKRVNGKTRLIFICNPNNPTGTLLQPDELEDFCLNHEKQAVIFSDEAYYDFIGTPAYPSMVKLVKDGRNVIVSKTFSKVYGLAGLRIGYLIARPDMATRLRESAMAGTNILAIAAAKEALADQEFYNYSLLQTKKAKQIIYSYLDDLQLPYLPSQTNFVFFRSGRPVQQLNRDMKQEGVLIGRPFPPLLDWARISTGTLEEMEFFGQALTKVLKA